MICDPRDCDRVWWYVMIEFVINCDGDVGGWGRDPRKQQDFCTTAKKRQKQQISWALDVGVCYNITGTRFPCYISLSTIWSAHGNGNLFGTNRTKKCFRQWKWEGRVSTVWISTPAPYVSCDDDRVCDRVWWCMMIEFVIYVMIEFVMECDDMWW